MVEIVLVWVCYVFDNGLKIKVGKICEDMLFNVLISFKYINIIECSIFVNIFLFFFCWGILVY